MAILVVATMSVSLYAGYSSGFAVLRYSREDLRATQILVQKMESLRLLRWSDFTSQCPIVFNETFDASLVPTNSSQYYYSGVITTNDPSDVPITTGYRGNLTQVKITLYWTNKVGDNYVVRSRDMETYVARYGIQNYAWGVKSP